MHRPVLILTHAAWETPALIAVALGDTPRLELRTLDQRDPTLPPVSELGGVVVMGGPQDANDDQRHPGLPAERRLLAQSVSADVPVLAVCLGMQLLALSLDAKLHLRHGRELGFAKVQLTEQGTRDPLLGAFARSKNQVFLHWHSDAVELPRGAQLLASTSATPVQAFRIGSAIGTQFHPEADAALLDAWLATPEMVSGLEPSAVSHIREDGRTYLPKLRDAALLGISTFAAAVEKRRHG